MLLVHDALSSFVSCSIVPSARHAPRAQLPLLAFRLLPVNWVFRAFGVRSVGSSAAGWPRLSARPRGAPSRARVGSRRGLRLHAAAAPPRSRRPRLFGFWAYRHHVPLLHPPSIAGRLLLLLFWVDLWVPLFISSQMNYLVCCLVALACVAGGGCLPPPAPSPECFS